MKFISLHKSWEDESAFVFYGPFDSKKAAKATSSTLEGFTGTIMPVMQSCCRGCHDVDVLPTGYCPNEDCFFHTHLQSAKWDG